MHQTPNPLPPHAQVMQMVAAPVVTRSLWAMAELGVPDCIAHTAKTSGDIANELALDADALERMMSLLAMPGVFVREADGRFKNGPLGEILRTGVPGSARDYVRYASNLPLHLTWDRVLDVLRTGKPSFRDAMGDEIWDYAAKIPDFGERFHRGMTSVTEMMLPAFLSHVTFAGKKRVVDVGGGQGLFLGNVLKAHPALHGVLFDLPNGLQGAPPVLARLGVTSRCDLAPGSFFEKVPAGHDLYLMKSILHDWSDDEAARILRVIRAAMPPDGELWLIEVVLPESGGPHPARTLDLHMMATLGGKERSLSQWRQLVATAGLRVEHVVPFPGIQSVVVVKPS